MNYRGYLKSQEWKEVKLRFFQSKRFKNVCFVCGLPSQKYNIHHKTYKWLGREKLSNLVAICGPCHKNLHFAGDKKLKNIPEVLNNRLYELRKSFYSPLS